MADRRRRWRAPPDGSLGLAALFVGVAAVLVLRDAWEPRVVGLPVEVTGAVARPGVVLVDPPTLAAAVEAAGGIPTRVAETPLAPGDAVEVGPEGARVVRARRPLLFGAPLDPQVDPADALAVVPGVTPAAAMAVVTLTSARPDAELREAEGLSRVARERLARVSAPRAPSRIDVNRADAAALERLPGVGPALAARIVADRDARGPFTNLDALDRVSGIGPATVERLRERAIAGAFP